MIAVTTLTAVNVTRNAEKQFIVVFSVNTLTLAALALVWLPSLLKILGLVGGSFKAGGFEANVHGIVSPADAIDLNVKARQVLSAGDEEARTAAAQDLEESITRLTSPTLEQQWVLPDAALVQLARRYESLWRESKPGSQRTSAMSRIVNEARVRAASAPSAARDKTRALLSSTSPGDRIVGLALVQETASPENLEAVLACITGSLSAFEMYHALIAVQEMSPSMRPKQLEHARRVIAEEYQDPRHVDIARDAGLPNLFKRTLGILGGRE